MGIIRRIKEIRAGLNLSRYLGISLRKTVYSELWIKGESGSDIYCHIHKPVDSSPSDPLPGVVIVPGANSPGTDYDKAGFLSARDVASCGYISLHYDPSGRGRSKGKEDHWGRRHQEELISVIDCLSGLKEVKDIRVLSFSIGIIIATGALSKARSPRVRFLFDWEGPSNRFNTTRNDTHEPLKMFPTSDDSFWNEREAKRFIGSIRCGYFRYQADKDHVQGSYKGHAIELLNLAKNGSAKWVMCNDNPEGLVCDEKCPEKYRWVPEAMNHKGQMLKYLLSLG
jgi:hypothetical protein